MMMIKREALEAQYGALESILISSDLALFLNQRVIWVITFELLP
jgi:hypothetical protein